MIPTWQEFAIILSAGVLVWALFRLAVDVGLAASEWWRGRMGR